MPLYPARRSTIPPIVLRGSLYPAVIVRRRAGFIMPAVAFLAGVALLAPRLALAGNDAFDTNPTASGGIANFTGNFTLGTTTPAAAGTGTPTSGDALYFGTSGTTTLNNDLTAFSFAGLTFNTGASAFTIQGNAFTLTGNVANNSASLEMINNAITLSGATRTFSATSGSLTLGGGLTGFGNASDAIFTAALGQTITVSGFTGSSGGNDGILINGAGNTTIGAISEAAATNRGFSLTQSGTGAVTLTGANNLRNNGTGTSIVTLTSGTLNLANAGALSTGAGTNTNLVINGGTLDATNSVTALTYTGNAATQNWNGSFTYTGTNSLNMGTGTVTVASGASVTATITANTLTGGALANNGFLTKSGTGTLTLGNLTSGPGSTITDGAGTLALGTVTGRATGGTVDFGGTLANISTTSANTAANSIIGGFATVNGGTNFAVVSGGKIAAYSGTTSALPVTGGATSDQDTLAGSQTQTGNALANSLIVSNTANSQTLALGANNLTLSGSAGALLYTGGSDNNFAITGTGVIGGGTTGEFIVNTDAGTTLSIGAPVVSMTATAGSLTKTGTGTLVLSGASSYTGATTIGQGTVKVGVGQVGTTSGAFGNGSSALTLGSGTTLDLQGNNVTVGTTTANGGGTNSIVTSTAAATLTLNGGNLSTLTVNGAASLLINGGTGTTYLTTANATLIAGTGSLGFQNQTGSLRDNNLQANLGTNGILLFNGGGNLQTTTGQSVNAVVINGTGNVLNEQSTFNLNGAVTGSGRISFLQGFNVGVTVNGDVSAFAGTIDVQSAGTTSNNSTFLSLGYSGTTTTGSSLAAFTQSALLTGNTGTNTIQYTGTGSRTVNLGDLSTSGAPAGSFSAGTTSLQNATGSTTATFQVGALGLNSTYAGNIVNGTGTTAITKVGNGTWTLTGVNTYSGGTTVSGGTLLANNATGSGTGTGPVAVNTSGAILGGTGTISGAVTVSSGAILQGGAGTATGMLTLSAAPTLNSGSIIGLALDTSNAHSTLALPAGFNGFNSNQLFTLTGLQAGTYDNIITGVASGIVTTSWTITNGPSATYSFSDDGANIDLTITAVPEPSTWLAGGLCFGVLGVAMRRRLAGAFKRQSAV